MGRQGMQFMGEKRYTLKYKIFRASNQIKIVKTKSSSIIISNKFHIIIMYSNELTEVGAKDLCEKIASADNLRAIILIFSE